MSELSEGERKVGVGFPHAVEEVANELAVSLHCQRQAQFSAHSGEEKLVKLIDDGLQHFRRQCHRLLWNRIDQSEERLGKTGQIPLRNRGLIRVGVAS